jgi:hypothetical protein
VAACEAELPLPQLVLAVWRVLWWSYAAARQRLLLCCCQTDWGSVVRLRNRAVQDVDVPVDPRLGERHHVLVANRVECLREVVDSNGLDWLCGWTHRCMTVVVAVCVTLLRTSFCVAVAAEVSVWLLRVWLLLRLYNLQVRTE